MGGQGTEDEQQQPTWRLPDSTAKHRQEDINHYELSGQKPAPGYCLPAGVNYGGLGSAGSDQLGLQGSAGTDQLRRQGSSAGADQRQGSAGVDQRTRQENRKMDSSTTGRVGTNITFCRAELCQFFATV